MSEYGWLPDLIWREGRFESGLALFANQDGRITRFSRDPQDLRLAHRLPNRAMLPALVNVHSHSFQRAIRGRTEHRTPAGRDTFWTWREAMYHAAIRLTPDDIYHVARMAFAEMLLSGIATVGEFHYLHHAPDGTPYQERNLLAERVLCAARETGIRIALHRTAYVRAGWQKPPNPGQARFITPSVDDFIRDTDDLHAAILRTGDSGRAWVGVAPHSVRAVPLPYLLETVRYARLQHMNVYMHVAEQPAEVQACQTEHAMRPLELLHHYEILDPNFTGVHAIHITDDEIRSLAETGARVCACPTTERNLGDGIGPVPQLASRGVRICFGTDSNVQINLLEDARQLEYHVRLKQLERAVLAEDTNPEALAARLFTYATRGGADSLGVPAGSLDPGRLADFFTFNLNDPSIAGAGPESLLTNILFSAERTAIREVYVGGRPVALPDDIVPRFVEVQSRLWGPPR
jgi:formimidoylglutamate deiminase